MITEQRRYVFAVLLFILIAVLGVLICLRLDCSSTETDELEPVSKSIAADIENTASPTESISSVDDVDSADSSVESTQTSDITTAESGQTDTVAESSKSYIDLSESEINLLATLVYLEGGCESYECMKGIASVVVNRMLTTGDSLHEVIYAPGQFSVADLLNSYSPTEETLRAARDIVENGPSMPIHVLYFRASYYHQFGHGRVIPYTCIDNTYFSSDTLYMEG